MQSKQKKEQKRKKEKKNKKKKKSLPFSLAFHHLYPHLFSPLASSPCSSVHALDVSALEHSPFLLISNTHWSCHRDKPCCYSCLPSLSFLPMRTPLAVIRWAHTSFHDALSIFMITSDTPCFRLLSFLLLIRALCCY